MPIVRLSSKSQLVLPAAIRKRLAIKPGDLLQVIEKDDALKTHNTTKNQEPGERLRSYTM